MEELTELLRDRGAALVGFADLSPLAEPLRRGFPRAVSFCLALDPHVIAGIRAGPTEDYCREYDRTNERLTAMAQAAAGWLASGGLCSSWRIDHDQGEGHLRPV